MNSFTLLSEIPPTREMAIFLNPFSFFRVVSTMETTHHQTRMKLLALAECYHRADEETREKLRQKADFFPVSRHEQDARGQRSIVIRVSGQLFLVEDTPGGEEGVFALLLPII